MRDNIYWSDTNTIHDTHLIKNERQNAQNEKVLPVKKTKTNTLNGQKQMAVLKNA